MTSMTPLTPSPRIPDNYFNPPNDPNIIATAGKRIPAWEKNLFGAAIRREKCSTRLRQRVLQQLGLVNPNGWAGVIEVKNPAGVTAGYILLYTSP
jgi:hypothetical protein